MAVTRVEIRGRTVGIVGLEDCIKEIRSGSLPLKDDLQALIMKELGKG